MNGGLNIKWLYKFEFFLMANVGLVGFLGSCLMDYFMDVIILVDRSLDLR